MSIDFSHFLHAPLRCRLEDACIRGIFDAGFFEMGQSSLIPHQHMWHELHIAASGEYTLEDLTGNLSMTMSRDMVAIIPPRFYHSCASGTENFRRYTLRLELTPAEENLPPSQLFHQLTERLRELDSQIFFITLPNSAQLLENIRQELLCSAPGNIAAAEAYFQIFIISLVRSLITPEGPSVPQFQPADSAAARIDKIENFFNRYADASLRAENLAQSMNLSVRQLNRLFAEYYHSSFRQMLTETRLSQSKKLLQRTSLSVEEISHRVGYSAASAFSLAFRKRYAMTPGEYRIASRKMAQNK